MNTFEQQDTKIEKSDIDKNIVTILMGEIRDLETRISSEEITNEEKRGLEEILIEKKMRCEIEELIKENTFLLNKLENDTNLTEGEKVTTRATITRNQNTILEYQKNLQKRDDVHYAVGIAPAERELNVDQILEAAQRYEEDRKVA